MSDPTPPCARRGMAVRVPPRGRPGADVPPAAPAGAPGQHRLRAVPSALVSDRSRPVQKAPGHGRPRAASSDVVGPDRPCATPRAPGVDVPPATTAGAPGQHRLRAMANATVALPAGPHRPRQEDLPHNPANPRTLNYLQSSHYRYTPAKAGIHPSPTVGEGPGVRHSAHPTHQVHPAIQVPPRPRPCSTACTGFFRQHPSRAPPSKTSPRPRFLPSLHEWRGAGGEARHPPPLTPGSGAAAPPDRGE